MKKLLMLIIILTMNLTVFSQSVTDTSHNKTSIQKNKDSIPYKCFPIPIVKKITQDLIRLDSCVENLKKTNQELSEVYKKLSLKDSVITDMKTKETNYKTIIEDERVKYKLSEDQIKKLEFDLGVQKVKNKIVSFTSGGFILILTAILILKH